VSSLVLAILLASPPFQGGMLEFDPPPIVFCMLMPGWCIEPHFSHSTAESFGLSIIRPMCIDAVYYFLVFFLLSSAVAYFRARRDTRSSSQ